MNLRKKDVYLICIMIVFTMGITACSSQKETPEITTLDFPVESVDSAIPPESIEATSPTISTQSTEQAKQSMANKEDSSTLFSNADLRGHVVDFSNLEFSLSVATVVTDENGGDTMISAAPGAEKKEDLVYVTYGNNVVIQILTMSRAKETQLTLEDVDKSAIESQSSVLLFGSCQDTYHWTADKIVIVKWK